MAGVDRHDDLPPEDDWFAEPVAAPESPSEVVGRVPIRAPRPAEAGPEHRMRMVGVVGLVVVTLVVAGGILAWVLDGTGDESGATSVATTATGETPPPPKTEPAPTTPPSTTPTTAEPVPLPEGVTLREGDTGDAVRALQEALAGLGYDVAVDGDFGPQTEAAVKAFQTASGLFADGVVGPQTLAALAETVAGTSG